MLYAIAYSIILKKQISTSMNYNTQMNFDFLPFHHYNEMICTPTNIHLIIFSK